MATLLCFCMMSDAAAQRTKHPRPAAVDLELAFVVDASGSIDDAEMTLQRQGYRDALKHPRVQQAINGGLLRAIAVAYIEFAGDGCTQMTVGWTRIHDRQSADEFGRRILASERNFCFGGNAVSEALSFAAASIVTNKFEGTRRVIDLSGDGPNTMGEPVEMVRDLIVKQRIIINALAIDRPSMPDLPEYFKQSVTGGPGSFVIKAKNRKTFAEAILKKLIREIADRTPWLDKRRAGLTPPRYLD
jgi:hypothetical protein